MIFMPGMLVAYGTTFFGAYVATNSPGFYILMGIAISAMLIALFGYALHVMLILDWFPQTGSWLYPGYGTQELMRRRPRKQREKEHVRNTRGRRKRRRRNS
jgi:hypothetical protein